MSLYIKLIHVNGVRIDFEPGSIELKAGTPKQELVRTGGGHILKKDRKSEKTTLKFNAIIGYDSKTAFQNAITRGKDNTVRVTMDDNKTQNLNGCVLMVEGLPMSVDGEFVEVNFESSTLLENFN